MTSQGWSVGSGLENSSVLVTGATGGIGRAVCAAFASAGARVAAVDLVKADVEALVTELSGDGHSATSCDITQLDRHADLVATIRKEMGSIDVFVNLAAILIRRPDVGEITEADWDRQMATNLKACFFLTREVGEVLVAQGRGGRIILFTSQSWWTGGYGGALVYAASKGGIVTLVRGLARSYGPHGITVNAVAPGLVETPMLNTGGGSRPALVRGALSLVERPPRDEGRPRHDRDPGGRRAERTFPAGGAGSDRGWGDRRLQLRRLLGPTEWRRVAGLAAAFDVQMGHHEETQLSFHLLAAIPHGTYLRRGVFRPARSDLLAYAGQPSGLQRRRVRAAAGRRLRLGTRSRVHQEIPGRRGMTGDR